MPAENLSKLLLMYLSIISGDAQVKLPSPDVFLGSLLNVTIGEVIKMARSFDFQDLENNDVNFLLYHKNMSFSTLKLNSQNLDLIKATEPVKILIHGWFSSGNETYIRDIVKSYHTIGVNNVLSVDWSKHSRNDYFQSATRTRSVGYVIANFIMKLVGDNLKLLKHIHLIGHSLGAQMAAFAGQKVKNKTGTSIGRITALDAAAPLFEYPIRMPRDLRISSEDADYVDAIHTNVGFLGFLTSFATADYYVDSGGPLQPGCFNLLNVPDSCYSRFGSVFVRNMSFDKPIENSITCKLNSQLKPSHLHVINESYMHNVPRGAETHFKVVVVSENFSNLPLIKRHRLVNDILKEELQSGVHALSIVAKTPDQWVESDKIEASPNCRGGFGK